MTKQLITKSLFNHLLYLFIALISFETVANNYNNNRIAITVDGNSAPDFAHKWPTGDPDDIGATPATLAIMAKLKLQNKLVHYSYNNFIDAPAGPAKDNQMKISAEGSIKRWNFDSTRFFDVTTALIKAKKQLAEEINKSTANDPLYIILGGLAEFLYLTVEEVVKNGNIDALSYVHVISHSGFNENHLRRKNHRTWNETLALSENRMKYIKIHDQNDCNNKNNLWCSKQDYSPYAWMKKHPDESVRWMYSRIVASGLADISDCGMLYYLLVNDKNGNPEKFQEFIGNSVL